MFFFFKQKTAYELRISDWSSDVCSSDLSPDVLRAYRQLLADGELTVRVYGAQPLSRWERLAAPGIGAGFGNDMLRIGVLKGFADGSLGSTTALFFEPYLDAP